jgi:hypothetical protein
VRIHEFGIRPGSRSFVEPLALVQQFVASNGVESAEVSPLKAEQEVLSVGLRLKFEPVTVNVHLVTHDDQGPNPGNGLQQVETVKRDPKSLVVEICSLTFLS